MSETTEEHQRYTVAVDFDGVINSYLSGWVAADDVPDPPVEGAIEWLNEVAGEYELVILTTRGRHPGADVAITDWLRAHGFTGEARVTCEKVPAIIYIDDRGWRFRGKFPTLRQIRYAQPWRAGDPPPPSAKAHIDRLNAEKRKLELKQGRTKAELKQLKLVAEQVIDETEATGAPSVDTLEQLRAFLKLPKDQ